MQPIHVLADQEAEEAHALQLNQSHVRLRGPSILEGGVKLGGQATLLHGPHAMGTPEDSKQRKAGTELKTHFAEGPVLLTLKSAHAGPPPVLGVVLYPVGETVAAKWARVLRKEWEVFMKEAEGLRAWG